MTILSDYHEFEGVHWETGSLRNVLAYQGITAPHTGKPLSEALLLGISGGIAVGYFHFAYGGYDPHVAILTRNTFDPLGTLFERLAIPQNIRQTTDYKKAEKNLLAALQDGTPAIVWADLYTLSYNTLPYNVGMWAMFPIVVYGYEAGTVSIADRACVPLHISPAELGRSRGRVQNNRYRLMTLEAPNFSKLPNAVDKGIRACLSLYLDKPPKGNPYNFGLKALQRWADMLMDTKNKNAWGKIFPLGNSLFAGLTSAFHSIEIFGTEGGASRSMYADFLDEASQILDNPALREAATGFRQSAEGWRILAKALLPDTIQPFGEWRELTTRKQQLFIQQGQAKLDEIIQINARLDQIKAVVAADFPLTESQTVAYRQELRDHLLQILETETRAVAVLQEAIVKGVPT
jgi:hypothetical protein